MGQPSIARRPLRESPLRHRLTNSMLGTVFRHVKVPGYTGLSYTVF